MAGSGQQLSDANMEIKKLIQNYLTDYHFIKQFIKFCIVGGTAAVINFSIYYSFTERLGMWYIFSAVWAFLISAVFNFIFNKLWTFRNRERGREILKQVFKFAVVMVSGLLINVIIIYSLTDRVGLHYLLAWVFATGVVTFWNFGLNRFWTFRHRQPSTGLSSE